MYFLHGKVTSYSFFFIFFNSATFQHLILNNVRSAAWHFRCTSGAFPLHGFAYNTGECRLFLGCKFIWKKNCPQRAFAPLRIIKKPNFFLRSVGHSGGISSDIPKVLYSWCELSTCQLWLLRAQTWSGPGKAREEAFCICMLAGEIDKSDSSWLRRWK